VGGVLDGFPSGFIIDNDAVQRLVNCRRPGTDVAGASARSEEDHVQWLSGLYGDGVTIGSPIAFIIRNRDARVSDYDDMKDVYRPNHADFTYQARYGIRDHRGGGRASARATAPWVVAGAIALQWLRDKGVEVCAYTSAIGDVALDEKYLRTSDDEVYAAATRCPRAEVDARMRKLIAEMQSERETVGGVVSCVITGVRAGVGNPVFGKLHAKLAHYMMSINAVKGFEYGDGFAAARSTGAEHLDSFIVDSMGNITTQSNHSGGIQGGISNGADICFSVAFKPVPTRLRSIDTLDNQERSVTLTPRGRHDVCVVPRAVPIVQAMSALALADEILLSSL